jgi:hypothetical protein
MNFRILLSTLMLVIGALGFVAKGHAARVVDLEIGVAPPPPRAEVVVPEPRDGYIVERGHYGWDGSRYVWVEGQYIPKREGHDWRSYTLEQRGDRWHYRAGHWDDDD